MTHVPYRGTAQVVSDIIAGHIDLTFIQVSNAFPMHESGKARILAAATEKRLEFLPDIPTLAEVGLPISTDTWNAISAPPKTPRPIIAKLNRAINEILTETETKARFRELNLMAAGGTPEDMAKLKKEETERWSQVIRDAGIQPE